MWDPSEVQTQVLLLPVLTTSHSSGNGKAKWKVLSNF